MLALTGGRSRDRWRPAGWSDGATGRGGAEATGDFSSGAEARSGSGPLLGYRVGWACPPGPCPARGQLDGAPSVAGALTGSVGQAGQLDVGVGQVGGVDPSPSAHQVGDGLGNVPDIDVHSGHGDPGIEPEDDDFPAGRIAPVDDLVPLRRRSRCTPCRGRTGRRRNRGSSCSRRCRRACSWPPRVPG